MVPLKEFLDDTDELELQLYLENIVYADKDLRECTRFITYYNMLPNMKKGFRKSIQEVFPLITDKYNIYKEEIQEKKDSYEDTKEKLDKISKELNLNEILRKENNKNIS